MDRIEGLPVDGRHWWIRWVDHVEVPSGGTASPGVHLLLSLLLPDAYEDGFPSFEQEAARRATSRMCRVLAGAIAGLTIGTVFRDGVRVGRLEAEAVTMTFSFSETRSFVWPLCPPRPVEPPLGWPKGRYWIVAMPRYPLGRFQDGNCLVLRDEEASVAIPCFEIFRTLYAPHQEIALALLTGPWTLTWPQVANPDHTLERPDGEWQIGLRRRVRNIHAPVLANLVLSPTGKVAANSIYASLLEASQRTGAPPAAFQAGLPFRWDKLRITLRCMRLRGGEPGYFGFEITRISWPPPPFSPRSLWYYRDNSGMSAEEPTLSDLPSPFLSGSRELAVGEDGIVPVTSTDDPSAAPQSESFDVFGPVWEDTPKLRPVPKLESFVYQGSPRLREMEAASGASAGNPGSADAGIVRAEYSSTPRRAPSHRFVNLIELLQRLKGAGEIREWRIVRPPHAGIEFENGAVAWPFLQRPDARRPWCYLDRDEGRIRCAMVCEIDLDGEAIHWVEVETRATETFRAVLFRTESDNRVLIVESLMRVAEQVQGVWSRLDAPLAAEIGVGSIRAWKHQYEVGQRKRFSGRLAMRALRGVAYGHENGSGMGTEQTSAAGSE